MSRIILNESLALQATRTGKRSFGRVSEKICCKTEPTAGKKLTPEQWLPRGQYCLTRSSLENHAKAKGIESRTFA